MYTLTFSSTINDDIVSVIAYIRNILKVPMAAEKHVAELKKVYEKLKENPFSRPLVHNKYLASRGIRFIKIKNYMLLYYVEEKTNEIFLYRFMYARRDWINILTNDLAEE
ncbi:type II toxin-antitoxin system RelE/ParE family toxin [Treponema primitia]|uniref:type II toxin-antitoxin system RelE/ParE family toxin n=1 Tax=Treponema primitia TaxID=88058 RepID=UPI00025552F6|nr:type II toxin-antitoxin system RelE/ParE family toxin [Treponema primitia]